MEGVRRGAGSITLTLAVPVVNRADLIGKCLNAELTVERPRADPSDNTVEICFEDISRTLFQAGETDLFTIYPCVGVSTHPCTSADTVEIATIGGSAAENGGIPSPDIIMRPEDVVIQVKDPGARANDNTANSVNRGNNTSWQTNSTGTGGRVKSGVEITLSLSEFNDELPDWDNVVRTMSVRGLIDAGAADQVCDSGDPSPPCAPGRMKVRFSSTGNTFFDPNPTYMRSPLSLNTSRNPSAIFAEFEKLGTYVVEYKATATRSSTATLHPSMSYTDTGTYTFHVGPIAELEVRDGGPVPQLEPDQTAFSIVAVNNGPDDALGAKVEVTLPEGATLVRAIPSAGTYDNGVWDVAGLQLKGYYPAGGRRLEGEDLTLIVNCPTGGCGEATAHIYNDNVNHPYQVVINGATHTSTVYEHIEENNSATITARTGDGLLPPGTPVVRADIHTDTRMPIAVVQWGRGG